MYYCREHNQPFVSLFYLQEQARYWCACHGSTVYFVAPTNTYQVLRGIDFMRKWCCTAQCRWEELQWHTKWKQMFPWHCILLLLFPSSSQLVNLDPNPDPDSTSVSQLSPWAPALTSPGQLDVGIAADLMTCTHSPYWISHPASAYTPIVLIYFSAKGISLSFLLTPSLSACPCVFVFLCLCVTTMFF